MSVHGDNRTKKLALSQCASLIRPISSPLFQPRTLLIGTSGIVLGFRIQDNRVQSHYIPSHPPDAGGRITMPLSAPLRRYARAHARSPSPSTSF